MNNTTTKAAETAKKAGTTRNTGVRTMVQIAMLAAVATVLMLWEVPLPFIAPSFYKMDLSEVPIMIGAFAMGPLAAAVIELIKILLNFVLNGKTCNSWYGNRDRMYGSGKCAGQRSVTASGLRKGIWHAGGYLCRDGSSHHSGDPQSDNVLPFQRCTV